MDNEIFRLHAEVCKTLSHAKRLEILSILREGEVIAGEIVDRMQIPKANVSQHLSVLRKAGILLSRREGTNIFYRISSTKVTKACDLMREVLIENHSRKNKILKNVR